MVNQITQITPIVTVNTPCCNYNVVCQLMIAVQIEYYVIYTKMQFIITLVKSGYTDPNIHDHALYSPKKV